MLDLQEWALDLDAGMFTVVASSPSCLNAAGSSCGEATLMVMSSSSDQNVTISVSQMTSGNFERIVCQIPNDTLYILQKQITGLGGMVQLLSQPGVLDIFDQNISNYRTVPIPVVPDTHSPVVASSEIVLSRQSFISLVFNEPVELQDASSPLPVQMNVFGISALFSSSTQFTVANRSLRVPVDITQAAGLSEVYCSRPSQQISVNLTSSRVSDFSGNTFTITNLSTVTGKPEHGSACIYLQDMIGTLHLT